MWQLQIGAFITLFRIIPLVAIIEDSRYPIARNMDFLVNKIVALKLVQKLQAFDALQIRRLVSVKFVLGPCFLSFY